MEPLFTKEQARRFLRENNLKDAKSIEDAFIAQIKDMLRRTSQHIPMEVIWEMKKSSFSKKCYTT